MNIQTLKTLRRKVARLGQPSPMERLTLKCPGKSTADNINDKGLEYPGIRNIVLTIH